MARMKVILQKKIEGALYDIMPQTDATNVFYDGRTLAAVIAEILTDADELGALASKDEVSYTDLAVALKQLIDGKSDKGSTLAAYGINDAYTKAQIDGMISGAFRFRGIKDYVSELPATGMRDGDVWQVRYDGTSGTTPIDAEFAWNGTEWVELGRGIVDMSDYATLDYVNGELAAKVDKVTGKGLSSNDFTATHIQQLNNAVPSARTVNGKPLTSDIALTAADVGAMSATGVVDVPHGGTGGTTQASARAGIGASRIYYGTNAPIDMVEDDLFMQLVD